ncbi:hypothetical protein PG993_009882 [Apiospora rasikravindrae]|uniref:Uncharacterized protein n=1 Tax=Apiospora rasikravindrae TaxID=990691 RepID=A0ABR1SKN5_9PEZI
MRSYGPPRYGISTSIPRMKHRISCRIFRSAKVDSLLGITHQLMLFQTFYNTAAGLSTYGPGPAFPTDPRSRDGERDWATHPQTGTAATAMEPACKYAICTEEPERFNLSRQWPTNAPEFGAKDGDNREKRNVTSRLECYATYYDKNRSRRNSKTNPKWSPAPV